VRKESQETVTVLKIKKEREDHKYSTCGNGRFEVRGEELLIWEERQ
jgi:hypothetical protein